MSSDEILGLKFATANMHCHVAHLGYTLGQKLLAGIGERWTYQLCCYSNVPPRNALTYAG